MYSMRTNELDDVKSLFQRLEEDMDSGLIDEIATRLTQSMDEISVAKNNCEDEKARSILASMLNAAAVCKQELVDTWSALNLRNKSEF